MSASDILTLATAIVFAVAAFYGVKTLFRENREFVAAVAYMTTVAFVNLGFRAWSFYLRATGSSVSETIGVEQATRLALTLQLALGVALVVGLSLTYYVKKAVREVATNGGQ